MYRYINKFKAIEEINKEIKKELEIIESGKYKGTITEEFNFIAGLNQAKLILLCMNEERLRDFFIKKPETEKFIEFKGYKAPEETTTDILIKKYKKDLEEIKKRSKCYNCNFESFEECLKCSYDDSKRGFKDDK
jgi:hypothetical protein